MTATRSLLHFLRAAGRRDRGEAVRMLLLMAAAEVAVRTLALPRAARLFSVQLGLTSPLVHGSEREGLPLWARRKLFVADVVLAAWPGEGHCLRRSLVLGHRLRALRPTLVLGVRRDGAAVLAHAWVVVQGVALDQGAFTPLTSTGCVNAMSRPTTKKAAPAVTAPMAE